MTALTGTPALDCPIYQSSVPGGALEHEKGVPPSCPEPPSRFPQGEISLCALRVYFISVTTSQLFCLYIQRPGCPARIHVQELAHDSQSLIGVADDDL